MTVAFGRKKGCSAVQYVFEKGRAGSMNQVREGQGDRGGDVRVIELKGLSANTYGGEEGRGALMIARPIGSICLSKPITNKGEMSVPSLIRHCAPSKRLILPTFGYRTHR